LPVVSASPCFANEKWLRARGNLTVDLAWENGQVSTCRSGSPKPREVKVRVNGEVKTVKAEPLR